MAYQALYRKFRPDNFSDVKGQDHIVKALTNQIKSNHIGHAFLFCGTRGTGKTTVAKILARAVNCEHPVNGSPCNECETCRSITNGEYLNVIEIDAASNNGVDNIREIRQEVAYKPSQGKYKVYIIDEVHMLSTGAFNALLKTLEEPPEYVIFILATTEAHKVPITIRSRCQRYDFKRIPLDTIEGRLKDIAEKEKIEVEEKALRYLAKAGDGSMRDALSLMDQCIALYLGETLTYDRVLTSLGAVDTEVFGRIFQAIVRGDVKSAILVLEELVLEGKDMGQFTTEFIWFLRNLTLVKTTEHPEEVIDVTSENLAQMTEVSVLADEATLMRYIRVLSELSNQMRYSATKRTSVEIAIIKLCRPIMEQDQESILGRLRVVENLLHVESSETEHNVIPSTSTEKAKKEVEKETQETKEAPVSLPAPSEAAIPLPTPKNSIQFAILEGGGL